MRPICDFFLLFRSQINEMNYTILKLEEEITQLKISNELRTEMNKSRGGGGGGGKRERGYM